LALTAPRAHRVPPAQGALEAPLDTTRHREEAAWGFKALLALQVPREGLDREISHFVSTKTKRRLHRLVDQQLRQESLYEKMTIRYVQLK